MSDQRFDRVSPRRPTWKARGTEIITVRKLQQTAICEGPVYTTVPHATAWIRSHNTSRPPLGDAERPSKGWGPLRAPERKHFDLG